MASVSSLDAPVMGADEEIGGTFRDFIQAAGNLKRIVWNVWKQKACKLSSGGAWTSCQGSRAKFFGEDTKMGRHWRESGGRLGAQWNR